MSGGGGGKPQQTDTSFKIPEEFKPFLFGAPSAPSFGGGLFDFGGGIGGVMGDALRKVSPGMIQKPGGIVNEAQDLQQSGQLAPTPIEGEETRRAQADLLGVADRAGSVIDPTVSAFQDLISFDSLTDPRLENAAQAATRPITERLERVALPAVSDAAIGAGQFGMTRQGVQEAVLRGEADKNISDIRSRLFFNALQGDLSRKERVGGQAGNVLGLMQAPSLIRGQVGEQRDAQADAEAAARSDNLFKFAQLLQGFIPGAQPVSTSTAGGGPSRFESVAGGAATGAAMGSFIPGLGTGVGAAVGGLGGLLL